MLPESNPKKSCRGSHHALRLHRNLLQSQAPPLSARLSLPTRVRKTLEQSNKPTKLNNCLSAFSKTDHHPPRPALQPQSRCLLQMALVPLSSRIKPLLEMRLEALEHLFFNVFDVGEPVPTSDIAVFTVTLKLQNKFFH